MAQDHIWGAGNNLNEGGTGGPVTTTARPGVPGKRDLDVTDALVLAKLVEILSALAGGGTDTTVTTANEDIVAGGTEQSYVLPANTKEFLIRNRALNDLRLAYSSGDTASGPYLTIPGGSSYKDSNFYTSQTIYFQSPNTDDVIEIVSYV